MIQGTQGELIRRGINWPVRDVMVGVLRNARQLEASLTYRFYHVPAKLLACEPGSIRYIALYQSKRLFGDVASGVRVYGAVTNCSLVHRGDITELPRMRGLDELYYRFEIDQWRTLSHPIRVGGLAPGVCMLTNLFLLHNSRYFPELYIRTENELALYSTLRRASARTVRNGGSELMPTANDNTVMMMGNTIGVYTSAGTYSQHDMREFLREPYSFLQKMGGIMGFELR